jgi:hypothetical protein
MYKTFLEPQTKKKEIAVRINERERMNKEEEKGKGNKV